MKSYGLILLYLFTWRTVITGAMFLGLLLLALALSTSIYNPYLAFSLAVIAFMNLLGVPYLSAAPAMRKLISNRSLSIMPNFSFRVGLVLLTLTIVTAGFLPLLGWFFAMPGMSFSFALKLFIVISLYTGLMQLLLPSQHAVMGFSLAPFLILFLLNLFEETVWRLYNNDSFIMMLSFATLGLWFYALWILAHKRTFKPAFANSMAGFSQNNWIHDAQLLKRFDLGAKASPAGSVLLAYPATIPIRLLNISYLLVVSPLVSAILLKLIGFGQEAAPASAGIEPVTAPDALDLFLLFSLFTGCISSWAYGEIGARARLIWLRIGGSRNLLWRRMEAQLWMNIGLLSCLTLVIVLIASLFGKTGLLHYPLLIIACAFYDGYYNLCARVHGWSSLSQALVMLTSLGILVASLIATFKNPELNILFVLETGMVLLAVLFRTLSKIRFNRVDWQVLKPVLNKRTQAES
jgi:hypothetical protein